MPAIYRKTGSSWQTVKTIYRKTSGSWQSVKKVWRKTAGVWQLVFQQALTPTIEQKVTIGISTNANQTRKLTGTLYRWNNATGVTYNFASSTNGTSFTNISGASGTSTNPATGQSNTFDQYDITQSNVVANTTNYFIYISKAVNSTFGTEQTSSSYPESVVSFEMPRNITTLATGSKTTTSIALSWTATTGSGSYVVYYGTTSSPTTVFTTTTSTSTTVTGLSPGTTYYFRILPYTGSSGNGYFGNYSNEVSDTTTAVQTPGSPTGLTATDFGINRSFNDGRIDLSWTAPSNNGGSAITGYRIDRSTDGVNFSILNANTGSTSTTASNTALTSGQIYYYRVYAINSAGTGSASNTASATATTVPQTPTIGTASRVSDTQVSVAFSGSNGGKTISSVSINSSPFISLSYSGTTSPITVTGSFVVNGSYTFSVSATNANGTSGLSAASNSVIPYSVTAPSGGVVGTPTLSSGLSGRVGSVYTVNITTEATGTAPITKSYQWQFFNNQTSSWTNITNETSTTYTLKYQENSNTIEMPGRRIRCRVTWSNTAGNFTPSDANIGEFTMDLPTITNVVSYYYSTASRTATKGNGYPQRPPGTGGTFFVVWYAEGYNMQGMNSRTVIGTTSTNGTVQAGTTTSDSLNIYSSSQTIGDGSFYSGGIYRNTGAGGNTQWYALRLQPSSRPQGAGSIGQAKVTNTVQNSTTNQTNSPITNTLTNITSAQFSA